MEISPTKKKILLLLGAGFALGFAYSSGGQRRILKLVKKEWQKIDAVQLKRNIQALYRSRLIKAQEHSNGTSTFVLTEKGKVKELTYRIEDMRIAKHVWDGKWRIVIFDVPEKLRSGRDTLREKLRKIGFCELQKSVFVFPYECKNEIDFLIEFFSLRKYVRYGVLEFVDNDLHLRQIFHLI